MSNDRKKLEERLQRKIEQKKREKQLKTGKQSNFDIEESFASSSSKAKNHLKDWMKDLDLELEELDSNISKQANNNKFLELEQLGNEDQKQLQQIQQKIHEQQKQIDLYKYKMLELTAQHQQITTQAYQKSATIQKESEEVGKIFKEQCDQLKAHYQAKIDKYLEQIDVLLQEKAEFNQQCQVFVTEDNKMTKLLKDLEERYKKDIKNSREAFLVLEKERREKWEQSRIASMKEEATIRLQPKLQAIIKDSNDQIKKASTEWQDKHTNFKKQYTAQLNKRLQQMKQFSFTQCQKQKQTLRAQERKKLKENYEKLQMEFEEDRTKMRRMYKEQILELEKKRREEVEEFLNSNKISQEQHLTSVKKIRDDYEGKIRAMKDNVRERVSQELTKVEKVYQKKLEDAQAAILQENQEKFNRAKQKIDETMSQREAEAKEKLKLQAMNLGRDIQLKYQKKTQKAYKETEQQKQKLRTKLKQQQQHLLSLQSTQKASTAQITGYIKQTQKLGQKNNQLSFKIAEKEQQILAIRQSISAQNMQYEESIKVIEQSKRKEYQEIDRLIGLKREEKKRVEEEWLARFDRIDDVNLAKIQELKQLKNQQIRSETSLYNQLVKDLQQVRQQNRKIAEQLQISRNKIKLARK